ncbi:MAG TPA: malonyl-CoA synthase [Rhizomicrobium sp.]|nr:malonyl-CoA synthase [Rhizomicrobium sp.]
MSGNLFSFLSAAVQRSDGPFIIPSGRAPISFADAFAQAAKFANLLMARGVHPGDRVAVQVEKSPESLFLYLACLRTGAIYLPLNPAYTVNELFHLLADSEPRLMVCSPARADSIRAIFSGPILTLGDDGAGTLIDESAAMPAGFHDAPVTSGDLAAILYTSGTTGRPKGAMLSHGNLQSNATALKEEWRFTSSDVLLHALPIFHTHGLFVATNVALAGAAAMLFLPKFDPDAIFRCMPQATVMMGVPTFYTRLLSDPRLSRATTAHMRLFISGSAPLLAETHAQWQERTGHAILERYGMTETNMNTSNPYEGARKPGSVGRALPGTEIRIAGDDGKTLPQGEIGKILVRGPNVFTGYWRLPERTKEDFLPGGWFITGDMGMLDKDGYLFIVGREKDLIITGGLNVYPKEIETALDAIPGVDESAVFGLPHPDFGEGVTAVLVAKGGAKVTEEAVLAALKNQLANFKLPKRVMVLDEIPRNAMGKVQKNLLRARFQDLYR